MTDDDDIINDLEQEYGPVMCSRCHQLIERWDIEGEWVTYEWPKGLSTCGTISHPKHIPVTNTLPQ